MGDISFDERRRIVQAALTQARGGETYIVEMYEDRIVYETYGESGDAGKSFEVTYTLDADNAVTFGDRTEVIREVTYRRAAVKFAGKDTIEGLAMPFGLDTDGEAFTADTDYCIDWFGKSGRPLLYNHGLDPAHKAQKVGQQDEFEVRAEGVWAQSQLNANARYRKAIDKLIDEGALGYSAGAYAHLATKNRKGEITRWPWVELSLTPFPAHPGALGVHYVKSADLISLLEDAESSVPDPLKAALVALDEWADSRGSDQTPDTASLAEKAGRVSAAVTDLRDHVRAYADMRGKSGRVLSAQTRERLLRHPASLRELADEFDGLLAGADAARAAKSADLTALLLDYEQTLARLSGVEVTPTEGVPA